MKFFSFMLYMCTKLCKNFHPCGWYAFPQPSVLYQRPGNELNFLRSVLVVPAVLFWTESSEFVPGICWSHSSSLGVTAQSVPTPTGTTLAFTFHILSSFSFRPWYFSSFSCSFLMLLLCLSPLPPSVPRLLPQCLLGLPAPSCPSGFRSPTRPLPCYSPQLSEESPTWTWESLAHQHKCSCLWYQLLGCSVHNMSFVPRPCIPPLCVGQSPTGIQLWYM